VTVLVRPMEPRDANTYLETLRASIVGVASADYPADVIRGWAPSVTDENVALLLGNRDRELRVIGEIAGQVVGIGSLVLETKELRACYVSPAGLRRGVGTAIVTELERLAASNGVGHLELHATITAEPFYAHLGYRSIEKIRHVTSSGIAMEAIKMSKVL
jgi:putative acetyltransferase